jgi:hypothetical protein
VVRGFGDDSGELWGALNRWVSEDTQTRGIPTAYSFDYRVHVGVPMSQALVRASDRGAIRALFGDLGLRPGQVIAAEDMVRLLAVWLPESRVSRGLKALCSRDAALRRVAEVACIELQAWSGGASETSSARRTVALTATLRRLGRRRLRLGLAVRAPGDVDALSLRPGSDGASVEALGATGGRVGLGEVDGQGWRPVLGELSVADLMFARLRLCSGTLLLTRDPRTLVVLAKPSEGGAFREVDRVRLGADHLLLAVEPVRGRVERELRVIARAGFRVHESLPGLPAGWVAFEGVEVLAISDTSAPDLSGLVPLAWTEVAVEGACGCLVGGRGTPPRRPRSGPPPRPVASSRSRSSATGRTARVTRWTGVPVPTTPARPRSSRLSLRSWRCSRRPS